MINKDKIQKLDIYGPDGKHLLMTKAFTFPKDFFKLKSMELVSIRSKDLPLLNKDTRITVIFEYLNGTRIKCESRVDISTDQQLNFHVDDGIVLEERRRSYKVKTNETAHISCIERGDEVMDLEENQAVTILNINLNGIFMESELELMPGDIVTLHLLSNPIQIRTEILRRQLDDNGELMGYGCKFLDVSAAQEEKIARHLFECQVAEREKNFGRK